jgi:uncharacterized BrkB/YihY/UPF0761 family membrane protein
VKKYWHHLKLVGLGILWPVMGELIFSLLALYHIVLPDVAFSNLIYYFLTLVVGLPNTLGLLLSNIVEQTVMNPDQLRHISEATDRLFWYSSSILCGIILVYLLSFLIKFLTARRKNR